MPDLQELKKNIYNYCIELVQQKLKRLDFEITEIQNSANQETKSSMGDKYETAKAMATIEIENLMRQKTELLKQFRVLDQLSVKEIRETIHLGSMVKCNNGVFYFLAVSIGPVDVGEYQCMVLSPVSPMGKALMGKKQGDYFDFRGRKVEIKEVV